MSSFAERPMPPAALISAALVILATLAGVGSVQWRKFHGTAPLQAQEAAPLSLRELRFVDLQDGLNAYGGHVRVFDAASGGEYAPLRENDGFVRATLNALAFERHKHGMDGPLQLRLARWDGGRLTLSDPQSGAQIVLNDFGAGNRRVFERFLAPPAAPGAK